MFGTNRLRKKVEGDGLVLEVQEIFSTIQGEGPFAGTPAIFVRLVGCHLRCYFCDSDFESNSTFLSVENELMEQIIYLAQKDKVKPTSLVVITGGEPFLQNIVPLCFILAAQGFKIQIETAGNFWQEGKYREAVLEDLIESKILTLVCSPKTGSLHKKIMELCKDWKYLIQEDQVSDFDGLPNTSTQVPGLTCHIKRPPTDQDEDNTIWLQPAEAYKVGYKYIVLPSAESAGLADQIVTSSVRDVEQTKRNIQLATQLAMKFNYRISLQLHKLLELP